jgi:hypothetical protein
MESLFCPVHFISSPLCRPDVRWTAVESVLVIIIKTVIIIITKNNNYFHIGTHMAINYFHIGGVFIVRLLI